MVLVQSKLKANKGQFNKFGNYAYRSAEDILESVKPLLNEQGLVLTLSDEIVEVGGRVYVKATAVITSSDDSEKNTINATAFAREQMTKKGMDESQITGSASSYARKYALNGLFCIDDGKDADSMDNSKEGNNTQSKAKQDYPFKSMAEMNRVMQSFADCVANQDYETGKETAGELNAQQKKHILSYLEHNEFGGLDAMINGISFGQIKQFLTDLKNH